MENFEVCLNLIIAIMTGVAAVIPLLTRLVKTVKALIQEKKWNELVKMTLGYMSEAEKKYSDGADKKALVIALVQNGAKSIGYNLDEEAETKISDFIDAAVDASRIINNKINEIKTESDTTK